MSESQAAEILEILSPAPFDATLERLTAAISRAGLILFHRFDHQAGAWEVGLEMPPATVLFYGHPKGGTPIMVAAPLAALDLPLRALVRVREDGQTAIAFRPIAAALRRSGAPEALAHRLDPAQQILVDALKS